MKSIFLTQELYSFIDAQCKKFMARTNEHYYVTVEDVLYSLLFSTEKDFMIINDWDEGENNDPFWDKENNEHSAISFIRQLCKLLDKEIKLN